MTVQCLTKIGSSSASFHDIVIVARVKGVAVSKDVVVSHHHIPRNIIYVSVIRSREIYINILVETDISIHRNSSEMRCKRAK